MNENRTHLLIPCAATALLNELSLNNSRARSSAANEEAVAGGLQVNGELPGFPDVDHGRIARTWLVPSVAALRDSPGEMARRLGWAPLTRQDRPCAYGGGKVFPGDAGGP